MSQGYQSSLGIDSANSVTKGFEFTACSLGKRGTIIDASGLRGSASHRSERTRVGNYSVQGTIEMQPSPEELALLLPWIFGMAASGNVYALSDTLASRYVTIDKVAKVFTYAGCYVDRAIFKGSEGQAMILSLDVVGQTETIGNAGSFPSVTFQNTPPFIHSEAVLTLQSVTRLVKEWTLSIDNDLETMFYNSVSASRITRKDRRIVFECTNPFTSAETDLYNQALAGAAASLVLAQAGTGYSLSFAFATLQFPDQSPVINGRQEIPLHLSGVARMVGSTKELITTLVSTP
jgi:hypothetical protein